MKLITLPAVELVYRVAQATIGAIETGVNAGPYVERVQKRTGNKKGDAWCASYVIDVGVCALGGMFPVIRSGRVQVISDWAVKHNVRYKPTVKVDFMDLIVMYYPSLKRHAHIYWATSQLADGRVATIEGNTSDPLNRDPAKEREGWLVAEKKRRLGPEDRIIKWWQLLDSTPVTLPQTWG